MSAEDVIKILQTVGFPIAVCLWFMWRDVKNIQKQSEMLARMTAVMTIMASTLSLSEADKFKVERLLEEEKKP